MCKGPGSVYDEWNISVVTQIFHNLSILRSSLIVLACLQSHLYMGKTNEHIIKTKRLSIRVKYNAHVM